MTVDLTPTWTIGSLDLTGYPYSVDASSTVEIGEPEMVVESVISQLADGDIERAVRHGNRVYVIPIYVEGETLAELARAESDLRSEIKRSDLILTHDPGDGFAPASVYEVQTAKLAPARDDTFEPHLIRKYTLTLTCSPFARSSNAVTVLAVGPAPTTPTSSSVNTASTTTNWSAIRADFSQSSTTSSNPVTSDGDGVSTTASGMWLRLHLSYNPPSAIAMATTPILLVEMIVSDPGFGFRLTVNGVDRSATPSFTKAMPSGTILYGFDLSQYGSSPSLTKFLVGYDLRASTAVSRSITVYDISRSNAFPQVNARQSARSLEVRGTERTSASINVAPGSSGTSMGYTIVHTSPDQRSGYSPSLRQYRTSGNAITSESGLVSGSREPINTNPVVSQVSLVALPEGEYSLLALMRSTVAGSYKIGWNARTLLPGIGYLGGTYGETTATFASANTWTWVPIDAVTLPPVRSNGAFVQLNLSRVPVASEVVELDEWWALRMGDDCAVTILYDNAAFMWLDSPDSTSGVPRVWVGGNGDRSDAHHPSTNLVTSGAHVLHPDGTTIFVATSGMQNPNVTATYYPRWHSNAAE